MSADRDALKRADDLSQDLHFAALELSKHRGENKYHVLLLQGVAVCLEMQVALLSKLRAGET